MLIRNYGLFWRRDWIVWGTRGGTKGHLKGVLASSKSNDPADFREQQGIYCLYDDNFQLVYVGQAGANDQERLLGRLRHHRTDQLADRWTKFSWFGTRSVNESGSLRVEKKAAHSRIGVVLNHIEGILIAAAEPPTNRQGARFGDAVKQYLQYRDVDNLGPDLDAMVRDLWKKNQET